MDLHKFDKRLREITPAAARPFLCEGSPLGCKVFLVGLNPRTHTPFWPYWDVSHGCHKKRWLKAYLRREGKLGRTRDYIEILFDALAPIQCLETNLYAAWSNKFADLAAESRTTQVFDFLLRTIKPRLIFVHGRKAITHIERLADCVLTLNRLQQVRLTGGNTYVYPRHHLSFQLSKVKCREVGEQLRKHVVAVKHN